MVVQISGNLKLYKWKYLIYNETNNVKIDKNSSFLKRLSQKSIKILPNLNQN